jgi:hypothetical protein
LDKVFAKPFLGALDGHRDHPTCIAKHPLKLSSVASASADGEMRLWDLTARCVGGEFDHFCYIFFYKLIFFCMVAKNKVI